MKSKKHGRILAVVLAIVMCVTLLPVSAMAGDATEAETFAVKYLDADGSLLSEVTAEAETPFPAAPEQYAAAKWSADGQPVTLPAEDAVTRDWTLQRVAATHTVNFVHGEAVVGALTLPEGDALGAAAAADIEQGIEGFTAWTLAGADVDLAALPLAGFADITLNLVARTTQSGEGDEGDDKGAGSGQEESEDPPAGPLDDPAGDPPAYKVTLKYGDDVLFPDENIGAVIGENDEGMIDPRLATLNPELPVGKTSFLGWSLQPDGELFDYLKTPVTGDVTLYAVFSSKYLVRLIDPRIEDKEGQVILERV